MPNLRFSQFLAQGSVRESVGSLRCLEVSCLWAAGRSTDRGGLRTGGVGPAAWGVPAAGTQQISCLLRGGKGYPGCYRPLCRLTQVTLRQSSGLDPPRGGMAVTGHNRLLSNIVGSRSLSLRGVSRSNSARGRRSK